VRRSRDPIRRKVGNCEAVFPLVRIQSLGPKERKSSDFLSFSFLTEHTLCCYS